MSITCRLDVTPPVPSFPDGLTLVFYGIRADEALYYFIRSINKRKRFRSHFLKYDGASKCITVSDDSYTNRGVVNRYAVAVDQIEGNISLIKA